MWLAAHFRRVQSLLEDDTIQEIPCAKLSQRLKRSVGGRFGHFEGVCQDELQSWEAIASYPLGYNSQRLCTDWSRQGLIVALSRHSHHGI